MQLAEVMRGVECCLQINFDYFQSGTQCGKCPYRNNDYCINELGNDIIKHLKEYQDKEVRKIYLTNGYY